MRLIDAEKMKTKIHLENMEALEAGIKAWIDRQETVDAVEVVRCKDCKFNYANQIPSENDCQLCVELPISDEFYCAYGEREDEVEK